MKPPLLGDIHRNAFIFHHHWDYEITAAEFSIYKGIQHPLEKRLTGQRPIWLIISKGGRGERGNPKWHINEASREERKLKRLECNKTKSKNPRKPRRGRYQINNDTFEKNLGI